MEQPGHVAEDRNLLPRSLDEMDDPMVEPAVDPIVDQVVEAYAEGSDHTGDERRDRQQGPLAAIRDEIEHASGAPAAARTRSAEIVAEIEHEIVQRGWPVGEAIGHEAQLMERFDVSRSVLREAIRTLESSGVVTVHTGRRGGLVVTAPSAETVKMASSLYLDFVGVDPEKLYATWRVVQSAVMDAVIAVATDEELEDLRECQRWDASRGIDGVERSAFISGLELLARNPILELFFKITRDLAMVHGHEMTPKVARWFARQHELMADALVDRDTERARELLDLFLVRLAETNSVVARRRRRR